MSAFLAHDLKEWKKRGKRKPGLRVSGCNAKQMTGTSHAGKTLNQLTNGPVNKIRGIGEKIYF